MRKVSSLAGSLDFDDVDRVTGGEVDGEVKVGWQKTLGLWI